MKNNHISDKQIAHLSKLSFCMLKVKIFVERATLLWTQAQGSDRKIILKDMFYKGTITPSLTSEICVRVVLSVQGKD